MTEQQAPYADDSEMPYKVEPFTRTTTPDIATKLQSFLAGAVFRYGSVDLPVEDGVDGDGYILQRYLDHIEALQRSHRRLIDGIDIPERLLFALTEAELLESKWAKEAGE